MKRFSRTGQSVLEYTLILGVVIAAIILVVFKSGGIKTGVESAYEKSGDAVTNAVTDLSHGVFGGGS
ncbi:MAG: hypothetical protein FJZ10_05330 [Candidatus Omnitrophica bacterium]|nr:hypothetical protein [Candidatus Omnitrophota bacterium]